MPHYFVGHTSLCGEVALPERGYRGRFLESAHVMKGDCPTCACVLMEFGGKPVLL